MAPGAIGFPGGNHNETHLRNTTLVRAEMLRPEEIVFYYSFGEMRVTGTKLEGLHDLVHSHELKSLWCIESPEDEIVGPRVERIAFESAEDDQDD